MLRRCMRSGSSACAEVDAQVRMPNCLSIEQQVFALCQKAGLASSSFLCVAVALHVMCSFGSRRSWSLDRGQFLKFVTDECVSKCAVFEARVGSRD